MIALRSALALDSFHTPNEVREAMLSSFLSKGYTVALDQPFAGALVPLSHYQQTRSLVSIMVEVRRDLFLSSDGQPSERFGRIQSDVAGAILAAMQAFERCRRSGMRA
jgi:predicted N-formylglutamate amidohydrolase